MSSAALRRSASVNSASFNLRELSSSSSASSRRDNSVAFTQVYYRVLRVTSSRHSVALIRVMSSRPSVAPRRAQLNCRSPIVEVRLRRCSIVLMFNRRGPTSPTFNHAVVFQLHTFPCSRSDGIPSVANADTTSRQEQVVPVIFQFLQTVNIQTLKIQTVHSRLQLLQQLLLLSLIHI